MPALTSRPWLKKTFQDMSMTATCATEVPQAKKFYLKVKTKALTISRKT